MGISVNTSPQQITASVGETKIDVSVSGGIGPSGTDGGGYVLPIATSGSLGGVRIGSGISIDPATGVISASSGYTLPTATANVLGGVKIGSGVTITDGVISVSTNYAAASHTHDFTEVTDDNVYVNFSPEGGSLATALSGIDTAISGKASLDDDVSFTSITFAGDVDNTLEYDSIQMSLVTINCTQGIVLGTGLGITFPDSSVQTTAGSALNHAHSVTADITAGNWKVLYSNGSGAIVELSLGASGTVLTSNGSANAPTFQAVQGESFHPFLLAGM